MMRCEVCMHKIMEGRTGDSRRKIVLDLEQPVYAQVEDRFGQSWLVRTPLAVAEHKCPGAKK